MKNLENLVAKSLEDIGLVKSRIAGGGGIYFRTNNRSGLEHYYTPRLTKKPWGVELSGHVGVLAPEFELIWEDSFLAARRDSIPDMALFSHHLLNYRFLWDALSIQDISDEDSVRNGVTQILTTFKAMPQTLDQLVGGINAGRFGDGPLWHFVGPSPKSEAFERWLIEKGFKLTRKLAVAPPKPDPASASPREISITVYVDAQGNAVEPGTS